MATITVQAGSALHVLSSSLPGGPGGPGGRPPRASTAPNGSSRLSQPPPPPPDAQKLQDALLAIRETSKSALAEMRSVLGQLRGDAGGAGAQSAAGDGALGLSRLPELRDAVTAAGSPVTVTVEGEQAALPPAADHAAYRILQESLTNVLRHAAPGTPADVRLRYEPGQLTITVANDAEQASAPVAGAGNGNGTRWSGGAGGPVGAGWSGGAGGPVGAGWSGGAGGSVGAGWSGGNGIRGMRERTARVGGTLEAGPTAGGFAVTATIPRTAS